MKNFFILSLSLLALPAFAAEKNLTGRDASAMMAALIQAKATGKRVVESVTYSVRDIRCGASASRGQTQFTCELKDENSGRVVREQTRAEPLFRALQRCGIRPEVHPGGLLLKAAKVACKSGSIGGMPGSCRVSW